MIMPPRTNQFCRYLLMSVLVSSWSVSTVYALEPKITSLGPNSAVQGRPYTYQVKASDPEGQVLSYQLLNSPESMTISEAGLITWTPASGSAKKTSFTVQITDKENLVKIQTTNLNVLGQSNRPPKIGQKIARQKTNYGGDYRYNLKAVDPDGDALTYSLASSPEKKGLKIDNKGVITWDWVNPSRDDVGERYITVNVSDGRSKPIQYNYWLSVIDPDNHLPTTAQPAAKQTINYGEPYRYDLGATDADGDQLTYKLSVYPRRKRAGIRINKKGVVTWTPKTRKIVGDVYIMVKINDGHLGVTEHNYWIEVKDPSNRPPVIGQEPVVADNEGAEATGSDSGAPLKTTINYGELYRYDLKASDPEGDKLTYKLSATPKLKNGPKISKDGVVTWKPTSRDSVGDIYIAIDVMDGHLGVTKRGYYLSVKDPDNRAPEVVNKPIEKTILGETYSYDLQATDADGDSLTYKISSHPKVQGLKISDKGVVTWTPNQSSDKGDVYIMIRIEDGHLGVTDHNYTLSVISSQTQELSSQSPNTITEAHSH